MTTRVHETFKQHKIIVDAKILKNDISEGSCYFENNDWIILELNHCSGNTDHHHWGLNVRERHEIALKEVRKAQERAVLNHKAAKYTQN